MLSEPMFFVDERGEQLAAFDIKSERPSGGQDYIVLFATKSLLDEISIPMVPGQKIKIRVVATKKPRRMIIKEFVNG